MRKLVVEIPDKMHEELRNTAIIQRRSIREVVTDLLEAYFSQQKPKRPMKETGLFGSWEDQRNPQKIVEEIRRARNWFNR